MLYIGSDNELPVIEWQQTDQSLCVSGIPDVYAGVKKHFTKKYQYAIYPKADMGCVCGLHFDEADDIDDITQHDELSRKILGDIFGYIGKFVSDDSCELVSCWTGDEEEDCDYKEIINIDKFNWKGKFTVYRPSQVQEPYRPKGKHMTVYKEALKLIIKKATEKDAEALCELYMKHLTAKAPAEQQDLSLWQKKLRKFENDPLYHLLVGETDNKIVSSVTLIIIENLTHNLRPYAVIENVVTHADYRGRHYATGLMNRASEIAGEHGCYKIMLLTGSKKESTLRFYENCGFNKIEKTGFIKRL